MVRSLQGHAEKLAIADLLRREKEAGDGDSDEPLELSINFKVCADCHSFFKAVAGQLGRQITVREPKLTHVFLSNGECSCDDRWRWEARREKASGEVKLEA